MTAAGPITLERIYFRCSHCEIGDYPLDEQLGLSDTLAPGARRMACLAGTLASSFARGVELLSQLAGWTISDETLRLACYREGARMQRWRSGPLQSPPAVQPVEEPLPAKAAAESLPAPMPAAGIDISEGQAALPPVQIPEDEVVSRLATQLPCLAEALAPRARLSAPIEATAAIDSPGAVAVAPDAGPDVGLTREAEIFQKALGNIELQIDAGKVNTIQGWRDIKVGIFAKRKAGEPATPEQWDKRELPSPTVRVAFVAIEECELFGPRCRQWAARLGIRQTAAVSGIADGADWIWALIAYCFCQARVLLDIYHALEHVGTASRALFGKGSEEGKAWQARMRHALLSAGWPGLCAQVLQTLLERPDEATRAVMDEMVGYFAKRLHLLDYAQRLQRGEPIGSGMVEGAVKTMINKRLKANGARWQVRNVTRMAELCALHYSDSWAEYWAAV